MTNAKKLRQKKIIEKVLIQSLNFDLWVQFKKS